MRLGFTALALACAHAALCGQSRADEIYTFTTTSMSATPGTVPANGLPLTATLDLTDAQVATGAFDLNSVTGNSGSNPNLAGDVGGFSRITILGDAVTPAYLYGDIATAFTFDAAGDVTSSSLRYLGMSVAAQVSGTGATASGYVGSDYGTCGLGFAPAVPTTRPGQCSVSGYWTRSGDPIPSPVPEPASLALLGAGLIGLGVAKRRRAPC